MSDTKQDDIRKRHDVVPADVQKGDVMAFIYYTKVERVVEPGKTIDVTGLTKGAPQTFRVDGPELIAGALSADRYYETVSVSMSKAAEILVTSHNTPFTVCFTKKDNTERILRGRLIAEEPHTGYTYVEDLERPEGDRVREVNNREIKWLIVNGTRYNVRGRK